MVGRGGGGIEFIKAQNLKELCGIAVVVETFVRSRDESDGCCKQHNCVSRRPAPLQVRSLLRSSQRKINLVSLTSGSEKMFQTSALSLSSERSGRSSYSDYKITVRAEARK
jgi:hypothetical protein